MPTTPVHALPYPAPTDPADVPTDMGKLALALDPLVLPGDVVQTAAARVIAGLLAAADANPAWRIRGDGMFQWGPGGANPLDTSLYRSAAGLLTTPGGIVTRTASPFTPGLKVDGGSGAHAIQVMRAVGDGQPVWVVDNNGTNFWGPGGATAVDTKITRVGVNQLQTDGDLYARTNVVAQNGGAAQVLIGAWSAAPGIAFGSAMDTQMWRLSAGVIFMNGTLSVASGVQLPSSGATLILQGNLTGATPDGATNSFAVFVNGALKRVPLWD